MEEETVELELGSEKREEPQKGRVPLSRRSSMIRSTKDSAAEDDKGVHRRSLAGGGGAASMWARAGAASGADASGSEGVNTQSLPSMVNRWATTSQQRMDRRRKVLEKAQPERELEDLYLLEELLLRVKFISNLSIEKRLEVCRVMTYENVLPNTAVCRQGDLGTTFYIVLSGSLNVTVTNEISGQEVTVTKLFAGDSFGELALMMDMNRRSATVTTRDQCELLKVAKADYDFILKRVKAEELNEKVSFLGKIPIFRNNSRQSLQGLAYVLANKTFAPGSIIARQGTEAEEMFFIKSGECKVLMTMNVPQALTLPGLPKGRRAAGRASTGTISTSLERSRRATRRGDGKRTRQTDPGSYSRDTGAGGGWDGGEVQGGDMGATGGSQASGSNFGGAQFADERVFLEVGWLREGDFFGEIGVVQKSIRRASIVAYTTVELLVLSKWDFNRRIDGEAMNVILRAVAMYDSTDNLRKEFVRTRRWEAYKKSLVDSIVSSAKR